MSVERIEWACPDCGKRYSIPAQAPRPSRCPECRNRNPPVVSAHVAVEELPPQIEPALDVQIETEPAENTVPEIVTSLPPVVEPARRSRRVRYPALRTISLCYRILAIMVAVVAIVGIVAAIANAAMVDASTGRTSTIIIGMAVFGGGLLTSLLLFAFSELIRVQLDIEENTRKAVPTNP